MKATIKATRGEAPVDLEISDKSGSHVELFVPSVGNHRRCLVEMDAYELVYALLAVGAIERKNL
jgi:hypothetical protein